MAWTSATGCRHTLCWWVQTNAMLIFRDAKMDAGQLEDDGQAEKTRQDLHGLFHAGIHVVCRVRLLRARKARSTRYVSPMLQSISMVLTRLSGLADTLQCEFMLYDIDIQIFFPPTIYSPGYENENRCKPDIVKRIEDTDDGLSPEQAASAMLQGVARGDFHISADLLTDIFRAGTRGAAPRTNWLFEIVYNIISYVCSAVHTISGAD